MPRRIVLTLLALAVLGFSLRVGAIFALHRWTEPNAIEHRALAMSLLKHHTFYFRDFNNYGPSSVQSPPYPFLLATLFKIFGPMSNGAYIAAMIINSLAGAVTVWVTYLMAKTLGAGDLVGLLSAGLVAVWPSQVYSATVVQAISLITLGTVAMIYFFQRGITTGRVGPWLAYAVIGCVSALTEPVFLPILAASGLFIFAFKSLSFEQRLRNAALLLGAAMLIIVPWTIRNRVVHSAWVPVKNTFWVNVWKGNNPNATGTDRLEMSEDERARFKITSLADTTGQDVPHQYDALTPEQRAELNRKPEAEREQIFKKYASSWIAANPGKYAQLCFKRLGMTLLYDRDNPKANLVWIISRIALIPLTLLGLWLARRNGWRLMFPLLVWGSALITYSLTVTANRFAIPFEPFQLTLTALVVSSVFTLPQSQALPRMDLATSKAS